MKKKIPTPKKKVAVKKVEVKDLEGKVVCKKHGIADEIVFFGDKKETQVVMGRFCFQCWVKNTTKGLKNHD